MFEKFSEFAEKAATNASRRQFLGWFGKSALAAAAAAGGLLALTSNAEAGTVLCDASSHGQCRGRPVGSLCGARERPGTCQGAPSCRCVLRRR
jgi:hypothetical protein